MKRIGIALSGGSVKGVAAHAGFMKYVEEKGFNVVCITGTSAGSIVAGLWGSGMKAAELMSIVSNLKKEDFVDQWFQARVVWKLSSKDKFTGAMSGKTFEKFLTKLLKVKTFEECPIPTRVVATNLSRGCPQVFDKGLMVPAIRSSMSIPLVFDAKEVDGEYFEDGGMVSNSSLLALDKVPNLDLIISNSFFRARTSPDNSFLNGSDVEVASQMMNRRFEAVQWVQEDASEQLSTPVMHLSPEIPTNVSLLNPDQAALIKTMEYGYTEARKALENVEI